jgi:anti-sigma factor RsiW
MSTGKESPDEPVIARDATYYRAPGGLKERLRASVAQEAREQARQQARDTRWWRWGGMAASFAMAGLLTWNVLLMQSRGNAEDRLEGEITTAHIRSLMSDSHLNDVASTDRHTVKPWFQGKLDFAPNVVDLAGSGYALIGGRLDYLNARPVAALTFRHRLHVINLFEWPAATPGDKEPEAATRQGYSMVHWKRGSLEYWAISDGAAADILEFAKLYPVDN